MPRAARSAGKSAGASPTIADVAARAGVSAMTVSRVVNGQINVADATQKRVRSIIADLGYVPNPAARAQAGTERLRVGVPYVATSAFFLSEFLLGGLNGAGGDDVQIIVEESDQIADQFVVVRRLLEKSVDGVILPPPLCESQEVLAMLHEAAVPFVTVASGGTPMGRASIGIDDRAASQMMTRHLIGLGHRRIGFIQGSPHLLASAQRLCGYRDAMTLAGIAVEEAVIVQGDYSYRSGLDAAEELLSLAPPPTAIFASNDDMAAAAIAVAHGHRLDVPGDLSICGFDDTGFATSVWPTLTTIRQPIREMARSALVLLIQALRRPSAVAGGDQTLIEPTLIRRQSDAPPRRRPRVSARIADA